MDTSPRILTAALEGYGLAYVPDDVANPLIAEGA
jgi:hypothetical protein